MAPSYEACKARRRNAENRNVDILEGSWFVTASRISLSLHFSLSLSELCPQYVLVNFPFPSCLFWDQALEQSTAWIYIDFTLIQTFFVFKCKSMNTCTTGPHLRYPACRLSFSLPSPPVFPTEGLPAGFIFAFIERPGYTLHNCEMVYLPSSAEALLGGRGEGICVWESSILVSLRDGNRGPPFRTFYRPFLSLWTSLIRLTLSLQRSKRTFSQPFKEKCKSEVVRIGSIIIFHLSKLWKAKFFILCDVIFLVRLQGKFEIDHSWEWKG